MNASIALTSVHTAILLLFLDIKLNFYRGRVYSPNCLRQSKQNRTVDWD
jgi:hypothetical protein